jgi:hypothetical protein
MRYREQLAVGTPAQNVAAAWKLVETAKSPFEVDQQRYAFLEKAFQWFSDPKDWEKIQRLHKTFTDNNYRDWASLAIAKYLTQRQRADEIEPFIKDLSPFRRSWAYWEMSRLSHPDQKKKHFDKAVEIVDEIKITTTEFENEEMEILSAQLRIFGRAAFQNGWKEQGERLLEKSEAATAALTMPLERSRLQCFLGKVLVELKQVDAIQNYLAIDKMLESCNNNSERSRVLVWLAEAGWSEGWTKAVEVLSVPERGIADPERVVRLAGVLKRYVAHHQGGKATGDPSEDSLRISGEEFETLYFSPFAAADCGCY